MTFEQFLTEKHAEDYIGTKTCMIDDFSDWLDALAPDDFIDYADQFAKEKSKGLLEACKMALPHLKIIQRKVSYEVLSYTLLKQAIAETEEA